MPETNMNAPSSHPIKCGLMLPTHAPRDVPLDVGLIAATAEWAEASGFDAVWTGDHIVHPWHFMESLISLTFVAARTKTIGIGTCVLLLPMRQLSVVAAQISTLATLSGGRLRIGIGIGGEWPREWQAAGIPLKERGARLDEALPLLQRLLAGEVVTVEGRFNSFSGISVSPVPPPVPIFLGGRAEVALARIGRLADGWLGFFVTPNGFRRDSAVIDQARLQAGRAGLPFERGMLLHFHLDRPAVAMARALELNFGFPQELQLAANDEQLQRLGLAGTPEDVATRMQEYIDAGCTTFSVSPIEKESTAYQRQVRRFASEVLPRLKPATIVSDRTV
jgi:alkanesulfonate monooxygenase SsuD/methylene tetrahydromethanopterin reductase-like flavin-dependent oxidoreductase (luciferase family)